MAKSKLGTPPRIGDEAITKAAAPQKMRFKLVEPSKIPFNQGNIDKALGGTGSFTNPKRYKPIMSDDKKWGK